MVSATGIGSGLDIEGLVSQLVSAERAPVENRLLRRESTLTSELSAFGTLKGALADFQGRVSALDSLSTFTQRTASSSNTSALGASASAGAAAGSYSVVVDQLAQAQSLASGAFGSLTDTVGEGTLTLRFGTTDYTPADPGPESYNGFVQNPQGSSASIAIDSSNNTLQGVRDAINAADAGVTAAIVNDGGGFRLLLSSSQTGAANSVEISVADSGDGNDLDNLGLSRLAFNADASNLGQTNAARDALFSINGLSLSSASNTVTEAVDGLTLSLREAATTPVNVTVGENRDAVRSAITDFVEGYNAFVNTARNLTRYDPESGNAGPLQGDFSARSVISRVRTAVTSPAEGATGAFSSLAELGITTTSTGTLSIDSSRLDAALQNDFDSVASVFAQTGSATDSNIAYLGAGSATEVGDFPVTVTQLASRGFFEGSAIAPPEVGSPLTIDANNDTLLLRVNGVESGSISLTQGSYDSGAALAAEIQSRINGNSNLLAAGVSVDVSFTSDNTLQIRSSRYGAESGVEITGVDATSGVSLGLDAGAGTAGVDVAGTIAGIAAAGNGQLLTGAAGSAVDGLRLSVTGGTLGERGSVLLSRGIADRLGGLLGGFLSSAGTLDARTEGLQGRIDSLSDDREVLNRRMEALEARYRSQFNALDSLLAEIQSTGSFLSEQLAGIPLPGENNN
ncbi:MAG: flagellar filament capping protein FliD [Chromatocurvus sp.]